MVIVAVATICAAALQLFGRVPVTPWEPALAMEALRLNTGLPLYESAHATHLYGPLLTVLLAAVFQVCGFNLAAARIVMSIFACALVIFLSAICCRGKYRACFAFALVFFVGINFRTNLILFSVQPDWTSAFLAVLALYLWSKGDRSVLRTCWSLALFAGAMLFKQTAAAFVAIPVVHVVLWQRPVSVRRLAGSFLPALSILLVLGVIHVLWPEMFHATVTIPASIRVYPERAFRIAFYLFATYPIFLVALWPIWRSRQSIGFTERWVLSAFIVLAPVSIWTTCKSGSGYNSLLFAYLAMTALFVIRSAAIFDWLRLLSRWQSFAASCSISLAILVSLFFQYNRAVALLAVRHGDDKYDAAVAIARHLDGLVVAPQDPSIAYRAKNHIGRSLFFELDTHAVNGNWPADLPPSLQLELAAANHVVEVKSYVPTPVFEPALVANEFRPEQIEPLKDSAYTVWSRKVR